MEPHSNAKPRNHDRPELKKNVKSGKFFLLSSSRVMGIAKVIKGVVRKSKKAVKLPIIKKDNIEKVNPNDFEGISMKYPTAKFINKKQVKNCRDKGIVGRPTINCEIKKKKAI